MRMQRSSQSRRAAPAVSAAQSPEASRRRRPWTPTQADAPSATLTLRLSSSSPLAVSVSGPAFHPSTLGISMLTSAAPSSDPSTLDLQSVVGRTSPDPAPSSLRERARDYRGKCLYQSRKCENERALKRNGKAHNLCDEHRSKQNQHQRKFDAKKFSRKRRPDSDDDAKSGDDQSRSTEPDNSKREAETQDPEVPPKATRPRQDAALTSLAPPPPRKIRRFEGAKYAGRRSSSAKSQDAVKTEAVGLTTDLHALRPPFVPEPLVAAPTGRELSQTYVSPPHAEHAMPVHHHAHYPPQHPSYYPHQQHTSPYELSEQRDYYRQSPPDHPPSAPVPSDYGARPLVPLRPLAAIVTTPSARIPATEAHYHRRHQHQQQRDRTGAPDRGVAPESHQSQMLVGAEGGRPVASSLRSGLAERRTPSFSTEAAYHHQTHQVEPQRPFHARSQHYGHPQHHLNPEAPPHIAPGAAYDPKYSSSELMAASILVPDTAPISGHVQYAEPTERTTGAQYPHQHPHTSISPRDVAPMHPSTYAISPHHGRLQHPSAAYASADKHLPQYYVRAQQSQSFARRADSERFQHQHRQQSDAYTLHHHQRMAPSPPQYAPPGASRMLPSLATRVATAQPSPSIAGVPPRAYAPPPPQYQHPPPPSSRHSPPPQFAPALPSLRSRSAADLTQHHSPPTTSSV